MHSVCEGQGGALGLPRTLHVCMQLSHALALPVQPHLRACVRTPTYGWEVQSSLSA